MSKNVKINFDLHGLDELQKEISESISNGAISVDCPYCANPVTVKATLETCPYCGKDFKVEFMS